MPARAPRSPPGPARNLAVARAIAFVRSGALKPAAEPVPLRDAYGRVLAADVTAKRDQPPFAASAMDGYAVRRESLETTGKPVLLKLVGRSLAGAGYHGAVAAGEAVRIFTGAPVPPDCDTIIIQEDTVAFEGGIEILPDGLRDPRDYIRSAGQDFHLGDVLLRAGARLDPWRLSLAAAAGRDCLSVAVKPKVAVLCSGDELVLPEGTPGPDQIYESASHALMALIAQWGGAAVYLGVEGDDERALYAALKDVAADLIVTVGGASVGEHDLVKPALARLGLALDFETLNLRPGKPTSFGRLGDGRRVLGAPGNPASAFVVAQLLLKPWIEASLGVVTGDPVVQARCTIDLSATGPRESYLRAQLGTSAQGQLVVTPFADQDSSLVSVFADADALVRLPANAPAVRAGDTVDLLPLDRL